MKTKVTLLRLMLLSFLAISFLPTNILAQSGNNCFNAIILNCGQVLNGSTIGATNDYTLDYYSCHTSQNYFDGPDRVYKIIPSATGLYEINLTGLSKDLDLFLLQGTCNYGQCIAKSTNNNASNEKITISLYIETPYYLIIDGYNPSQSSNFQVSLNCPGSGGFSCESIPTISCGSTINASNSGGGNDFKISNYLCHSSSSDFSAPDREYYLDENFPGTFTFTVSGLSADLDIFLIKNLCNGSGGTCIAKSTNSGNTTEKIGPITLEAGLYYIIVDGYNSNQISNYTLKVDCVDNACCCNNVEELTCGQTYTKSTLNTTNQFSRSNYTSCLSTNSAFDGNDIVFKYNHNSYNKNANVVIWGYSKDLDMFLFNYCKNTTTCVKSAKNQQDPYEAIDFSGLPFGDYYIVVDGYDTNQKSQFNIQVNCQYVCAIEGVSEPITCNQIVQSTTTNSARFFSKYSCNTSYEFTGPEKYYFFTATTEGEHIIDLSGFTNDLELFVLDLVNCTYAPICIASSTNGPGNPEQIKISLQKGQSITIAVDGALGASGPFQIKVSCPSPKTNCLDCFQCFRWRRGGNDNEVFFENTYCEDDYVGIYSKGIFRGAVTYDWDFSGENINFLEGTTKSSQHPRCRFPREGKYKVCLKVYKLGILIFECCKLVHIKSCSTPPVASVVYSIDENNNVQFDASTAQNAEGFEWDFGDGTSSYTDEIKPKRKYNPGRCYTVCLNVYNGCGASQMCVTVCPGYSPCTAIIPRNLTFNTTITDDIMQVSGIVNTDWDKLEWKLPQDVEFDPGSGTNSPNPKCKFKKPGFYVICAIFYYKCHKICICRVLHYPGTNPVACESICPLFVSDYKDCHSFEEYTLGNISPQKSTDPWILPAVGNDGQVVNTRAKSGTKSLNILASALSTYYSINRINKNISRLEWNMYFPPNGTGGWDIRTSAFNFQLPFDVNFNNGKGNARSKSTTKDENITFDYPQNSWFRNVLIFNSAAKTIELWINNKYVNKITYEITAGSTDQIKDLRFKNGDGGNLISNFFVDDLCYSELTLFVQCTQNIDPVCVNGKEFSNECFAKMAGYSEYEWTKGACSISTNNLLFDIDDNVCDMKGKNIQLPVRIMNFNNIRSFSMSVTVDNPGVFEISNLTSPIAGLTFLTFESTPKRTFTVQALSQNGITLADGTIVFYINGTLMGNSGQTAKVSIVSSPTPIKGGALVNNQNVEVPVKVIDGSACINSIALISLSGKVITRANKGIKSAQVNISGSKLAKSITDNNGDYKFSDLNTIGNYTLTSEKNNFHSNGIDIFDLADLQDHILTRKLISDPYKQLAADVNKDGAIDIFDLAELQDIILTRISQFSNNNSWIFIPTDEALTTNKVFTKSYRTNYIINNPSASQKNLDFYGIKIGDIDQSVDPQNLTQGSTQVSGKMETRSGGELKISIPSFNAPKNQLIYIPVVLERFVNIRVFQFSINWDPAKLEFQKIESLNTDLPAFGGSNVVFDPNTPGSINNLWLNANNVSLLSNSRLYVMVFKVTGNVGDNILLSINNLKALEVSGAVTTTFSNATIDVADISTLTKNQTSALEQIKIFPNPASDVLLVASQANIELLGCYDINGKIMNHFDSKEIRQYSIDISSYTPGVYFLKMKTKGELLIKRFIVQR